MFETLFKDTVMVLIALLVLSSLTACASNDYYNSDTKYYGELSTYVNKCVEKNQCKK